MIDETNNLINEILARDRVFGKLCEEAELSYDRKNYFSAIACLFVVTEQAIKLILDEQEGNFSELLLEAREKSRISESEFLIFSEIRELRNKLFHENHHCLYIEIKGICFPVDEDETKKAVYESFSQFVFRMILRFLGE